MIWPASQAKSRVLETWPRPLSFWVFGIVCAKLKFKSTISLLMIQEFNEMFEFPNSELDVYTLDMSSISKCPHRLGLDSQQQAYIHGLLQYSYISGILPQIKYMCTIWTRRMDLWWCHYYQATYSHFRSLPLFFWIHLCYSWLPPLCERRAYRPGYLR